MSRLEHLEQLIINPKPDATTANEQIETPGRLLSVESLLDCLLVLFDECQNSSLRREKTVSEFIELRKCPNKKKVQNFFLFILINFSLLSSVKPSVNHIKQLRLTRDDFEILKVIGRGAFGIVCVVRMIATNKIFAMKILNKWEMLKVS